MDTYSFVLLGVIAFSLFNLFFLYKLIINLIRRQIDDQIKYLIPIKRIRERMGVSIKFNK